MWSRFSTVADCHLLWVPQDDGKDGRKTLLAEGRPRRRGALGVFMLKTTSLSVSSVVNSACSLQCSGVASVLGRAPLWTGLLVAQSWGERAPSSCSMGCWVGSLACGLFLHMGLMLDLHSLWGRTQSHSCPALERERGSRYWSRQHLGKGKLPCGGSFISTQMAYTKATWLRKRHQQWDSETFGLIVVLWQRSIQIRQSSRAF